MHFHERYEAEEGPTEPSDSPVISEPAVDAQEGQHDSLSAMGFYYGSTGEGGGSSYASGETATGGALPPIVSSQVEAADLELARKADDASTRKPGSNARAWGYELFMAALIVLTFAVDQVTKTWVRNNLVLGDSLPPDGFFRFTHTYNTGSAFGLFPGQTFLLMVASLVGIGILVLFFRNQSVPPLWLRTSLGLQLGGAAGNLVDRITLGRVTDFIDVGQWPVFNIADSSILVGIVILAWFMLRSPKEQHDVKKDSELHNEIAGAEPTTPSATDPRE